MVISARENDVSLRQAFDANAVKTYASYANAERAFQKAAAKIGLTDMAYLIATGPNGRFYPVALPQESQVQNAIALAHTSSVCMFRN